MKPPSILLVFDTTALLAGRTQDWQQFLQVGECTIPQVVVEEIRFLSSRAPDPTQELTAREFVRFYQNSGWQVTAVSASHPSLKPAPGQNLSKRARQALSVAYSAYGLSVEHPGELVVLVANDQPLLQRVQGLRVRNLCTITLSALLEWTRHNRQPVSVAQRLRAMETGSSFVGSQSAAKASASSSAGGAATKVKPSQPKESRVSSKRVRRSTSSSTDVNVVPQMISGMIAVAALVVAGLLVWALFNPTALNQYLDERGLPQLPLPNDE